MGVRVLALVVGVAISVVAVRLLRRRTLKERYALLWMLVGVAQLVLAAVPSLLDVVADAVGVADPPNLLAFASVVFLLLICAQLTVEASALEERTRVLAEEVAMLRAEVDALRDRRS